MLVGVTPLVIDFCSVLPVRSQITSSPVSNLLRYLPVPTASVRPSGETAMQLTALLNAAMVPTAWRVLRSQMRTVLSTLPVSILSGSAIGATQVMTPP